MGEATEFLGLQQENISKAVRHTDLMASADPAWIWAFFFSPLRRPPYCRHPPPTPPAVTRCMFGMQNTDSADAGDGADYRPEKAEDRSYVRTLRSQAGRTSALEACRRERPRERRARARGVSGGELFTGRRRRRCLQEVTSTGLPPLP